MNPRSHRTLRLDRAAALAILLGTPLATASAQGGVTTPPAPCPDHGSCHLSRWSPELPKLAQAMGASVALSGDLALVGLPNNSRVEIWRRQGSTWVRAQTLVTPGAPGDGFGIGLAVHNDRIWVGAPFDDALGNNAGAAYTFSPDATGNYGLNRTYAPPLPVAGGRFGSSIAANGPWLAIAEPAGAPGGRVTVYTRFTGTALFDEVLTPGATDGTGMNLALDGNLLAIGTPEDSSIGGAAGAVFVSALHLVNPTVTIKLHGSDTAGADRFGTSVAIGSEGMFAGAPGHDQPMANTGSVYRFEQLAGPALAFAEQDEFTPCLATAAMAFGRSLALDGPRLVVGAQTGNAAYVLRNKGILGIDNWQLEDRLQAADNASGDFFGNAVGISGTTVLVGAPGADAAAIDSGAAYLFSLDPVLTGLTQCPNDTLWTVEEFGPGKPGSNGIPELATSRPLTPGISTTIGATNLTPGTNPFLIYGFQEVDIPFDGGFLHLADPVLIPLPTVSALGQVGLGLSIPPLAALAGNRIIAQVMVLDPGASGPVGIAQSRGYRATLGF